MDKNKQQIINSGLYLISTPIGNMEDMTLRALNVLKKSDIILCEDTRRSGKLISYFQIKSKLLPYHKFNEKKVSSKVIDFIKKDSPISRYSPDKGSRTPIFKILEFSKLFSFDSSLVATLFIVNNK